MMSLSTAKLLLFIALAIGPKCGTSSHSIEILGQNSYCVWTEESGGWTLSQLGQSSSHWPTNGTNFLPDDVHKLDNSAFVVATEVSHHNWGNSQNATLDFPNGDVIQKRGTKIYYTINAGAPNQQIYTILTIKDGKTL